MQFLNKYGVARHIYIPVIKRAVMDFALSADWTPAAGDVKISKNGGAAANVTNLPTAITMGNAAMWDFSLTATEMQAAQVMVYVSDSATKVVEDQSFIIETYGDPSAQHALDLSATLSTATDIANAVMTALDTTTFAEQPQGAPAATTTLAKMIGFLYKAWRNRSTQTATAYKLYADDATTVDQKTTDSDDGTTFDKGEIATGP